MKLLVYTSGPYTGNVGQNIVNARAMAIKLWEAGFAVICPHLNTSHFEQDCNVTHEDFLEGDLRMIEGCDAVLMLEGWEKSAGSIKERAFARGKEIPVFSEFHLLDAWAKEADNLARFLGVTEEKETVLDRAGVKYDDDKLRMDLIPVGPLRVLAGVYTVGAQKYSDRNWEKGLAYHRIYGATLRHLTAWWGLEEKDPEDGQHHLAAAAWGIFALLEYLETHPEMDDRPGLVVGDD